MEKYLLPPSPTILEDEDDDASDSGKPQFADLNKFLESLEMDKSLPDALEQIDVAIYDPVNYVWLERYSELFNKSWSKKNFSNESVNRVKEDVLLFLVNEEGWVVKNTKEGKKITSTKWEIHKDANGVDMLVSDKELSKDLKMLLSM